MLNICNNNLVTDHWIAQKLSVKPTTIRKQRFYRNHGKAHWLTVNPVYLGKNPRYKLSDFTAWLESTFQKK